MPHGLGLPGPTWSLTLGLTAVRSWGRHQQCPGMAFLTPTGTPYSHQQMACSLLLVICTNPEPQQENDSVTGKGLPRCRETVPWVVLTTERSQGQRKGCPTRVAERIGMKAQRSHSPQDEAAGNGRMEGSMRGHSEKEKQAETDC